MIRVAIAGTGAIADSHIQAYLNFPDRCRIVALADLYAEKASQKARQYNLDAAIYDSYQKIAENDHVDLVSVCLPPFEHAAAAIALLRAGKHVLVEKPMATCLEECDQMLAAASSSGKLLGVVAQNRYKTPLWKLKQVIDSKLAGRILYAQVESFWWRGSNYYDLWWRGTWEKEGGGCTMNHAVHQIDLFQWMMGMPDELQAVVTNINHENSEVEDFSTAVMLYQSGAVGQLTASLVHHGEEQRLVFQGEKAQISAPWQVYASRQRENGFPESNFELERELNRFYESLAELKYTAHAGQIANILAAIAGNEALLVDGRAGRNTIELVTAIYESGHLNRRIQLPLLPTALFYTRQGILQHAPRFHQKTRSLENFGDNSITTGSDYQKSGPVKPA